MMSSAPRVRTRHSGLDSGAKIAPKSKSRRAAFRAGACTRDAGTAVLRAVNTPRRLRESWRFTPADRNERLIQMIRESLILTSVIASVDLGSAAPRGRGRARTPSQCERVIAFLNKLAGVSGTVGIAGQSRSMICTVAPSSDASAGAAERCSGRIVLLGDDENKLLSTDIRFEARRGRGREPGSLTLTSNPSRLLTGADAYPTLIDAQSGKPVDYPSMDCRVTDKLLELPFQILAQICDANSSAKLFEDEVEANRIRIRRLEWTAFLPCSDPNALLEVLAVTFGLLINDKDAVLQLARHLGLWVKYDVDPRTNKMKSVSLEKRQGQRKLFTVRFSAESVAGNAVRLTMVAHADGLAQIVTAARSWAKKSDNDELRKAGLDIDKSEPNTASQLSDAFWPLGWRGSADQIEQRSLGDWLVRRLLRGVPPPQRHRQIHPSESPSPIRA